MFQLNSNLLWLSHTFILVLKKLPSERLESELSELVTYFQHNQFFKDFAEKNNGKEALID